ncbi:MAG: redox-regulated ATPase YchF [Dehalococcoidia bacterium]|nr:redox-regulated ATPase YchF [Dehalococcoidia bacterium]
MEIGVLGLPQSGKTTLFNALTGGGSAGSHASKGGLNLGVAKVPDPRLEALARLFQPQRIVPVEVKYMDVALAREAGRRQGLDARALASLQNSDAILGVVRAFTDPSVAMPADGVDPARDAELLELELAFADLALLEKRRQRITESLRGARPGERAAYLAEQELLSRIQTSLEGEVPLRAQSFTPEERRLLRAYQFLSDKPLLLVWNIGEEAVPTAAGLDAQLAARYGGPGRRAVALCAKLEMELAQLATGEAAPFRADLGLSEAARDRVIRLCYELLGYLSFLTVGPDEVRAWAIPRGTLAAQAAGKVHSDIERGFIRAQVVGWEELLAAGGIAQSRSRGHLRQEGRSYEVKDGDVIEFLFNL